MTFCESEKQYLLITSLHVHHVPWSTQWPCSLIRSEQQCGLIRHTRTCQHEGQRSDPRWKRHARSSAPAAQPWRSSKIRNQQGRGMQWRSVSSSSSSSPSSPSSESSLQIFFIQTQSTEIKHGRVWYQVYGVMKFHIVTVTSVTSFSLAGRWVATFGRNILPPYWEDTGGNDHHLPEHTESQLTIYSLHQTAYVSCPTHEQDRLWTPGRK